MPADAGPRPPIRPTRTAWRPRPSRPSCPAPPPAPPPARRPYPPPARPPDHPPARRRCRRPAGGRVTESGSLPLDWAHSGPIALGRVAPAPRTSRTGLTGLTGLTGSMPLNLTSTLTGGLTLGRRGRGRKKKQTVSGFDPVI